MGIAPSTFAGSNLDLPEPKTGIKAVNCHAGMAVDVYLRCIEQRGLLPLRVSDGSNFNRQKMIKLREHPAIGSSNCGQYIEIDAFNTCLNNLIREAQILRTGEAPATVPLQAPEGSADVAT